MWEEKENGEEVPCLEYAIAWSDYIFGWACSILSRLLFTFSPSGTEVKAEAHPIGTIKV